MDNGSLYITLACVFGFFAAWGIGANDVANAMSTSIGSRALTLKRALIIASVFELAGAVLAGGAVTATIRKGIVDSAAFDPHPDKLVLGMLSALLATGTWLMIASRKAWPVSTTHSIVGAIVGFSLAAIGPAAVQWSKIGIIAASWVASPVLAAIVAMALYLSISRLILSSPDPVLSIRRYAPIYCFLTVLMLVLVTLLKGLKHISIGQELSLWSCIAAALVCATIAALTTDKQLKWFESGMVSDRHDDLDPVERVFAGLMVITACAMAFAHGSNDVANAIGPVAAIFSIVNNGNVGTSSTVPFGVLALGGVGIVVGLLTYGKHVIATVGTRITPLTPSSGFAAGLAAAFTVIFASATGIPVSTTHALVGAVLGVGLAIGVSSIDLAVVRKIIVAWVVTIPAGAILSIAFYMVLNAVVL